MKRPTYQIKNSINIKEFVMNKLDVITNIDQNTVTESMKHLTDEHLRKGIKGLSDFMALTVHNKKYITTDSSRNVIAYRYNEEIMKDKKCLNLINKFVEKYYVPITTKCESKLEELKEEKKEMEENNENKDLSEYYMEHSKQSRNVWSIINLMQTVYNEKYDKHLLSKLVRYLVDYGVIFYNDVREDSDEDTTDDEF